MRRCQTWQLGLHALADSSLLPLELFFTRFLEVFLELIVGRTRLHNLLDLILSVLNNLIRPLFFSFEQLNPIVQSDTVKLNFLPTLTNLWNWESIMLDWVFLNSGCTISNLIRRQTSMSSPEEHISFAMVVPNLTEIPSSMTISMIASGYFITLRESIVYLRSLIQTLNVIWSDHRWWRLFAYKSATILSGRLNVLQCLNFAILILVREALIFLSVVVHYSLLVSWSVQLDIYWLLVEYEMAILVE